MKKYKIFLNSNTKNYIFTIAIGNKYLKNWLKYCFPNWKVYCKKNKIGLIVITHDLWDRKDKLYKTPTWQKMLLGKLVKDENLKIKNILYIDTDFLINPNSPNFFNLIKKARISVVSVSNRIPYDINLIRKKISFNRKTYFDRKFPLDSAMFMTDRQYYKFHGFKKQKGIVCMGLLGFNVNQHWKKMYSWYTKYTRNTRGLTNKGDNPYISYELLKYGKLKWEDYKYQTIWTQEMAFKYSFLYKHINNKKLLEICVNNSLEDCYFLHFAGSWPDSDIFKNKLKIFRSNQDKENNKKFLKYLKIKPTGRPKGRKIP
jgi:hypothetical protein